MTAAVAMKPWQRDAVSLVRAHGAGADVVTGAAVVTATTALVMADRVDATAAAIVVVVLTFEKHGANGSLASHGEISNFAPPAPTTTTNGLGGNQE